MVNIDPKLLMAEHHVDRDGWCDSCRDATAWPCLPYSLAEALAALDTWDGLMELLDRRWPSDVFPTVPDRDDRDPGPRIVSLVRVLAASEAKEMTTGPVQQDVPLGGPGCICNLPNGLANHSNEKCPHWVLIF